METLEKILKLIDRHSTIHHHLDLGNDKLLATDIIKITKQEMKNFASYINERQIRYDEMCEEGWVNNAYEYFTTDQLIEEYFQFTSKNKEG